METININMTPNCHEVETIHASQNDTSLRKWGIRPYDYDGNDVTSQQDKASIETIRGNTLVWNQVAPSMSSSVWVANRCTKTVSGNTFSLVGTNNASYSFGVYIALANLKLTVNHDYLFMCVVNTNRGTQIRFTFDSDGRYTSITPNKDNVYSRVVSTATEDPIVCYVNHPSSITTNDTATIKNLMIVDLTMLNDSRITDLDSFKTYYPLDYYDYNQGSLLSFMGNGIKTVSKNQFDSSKVTTGVSTLSLTKTNGTVRAVYSGGQRYVGFNFYNSPLFTDTFIKGRYRVSFDVSGLDTQWSVGLRKNASFIGSQTIAPTIDYHYSFTVDTEANPNCYLSFSRTGNLTGAFDVTFSNIQLEYGTTETTYTPFQESVLSLPSNEFPSGMNKVNNTYDERTPTKISIRTNTIVFDGTEEFTTGGNGGRNFVYVIPNQADYGKFNIFGIYSKGQWGYYEFNSTESQYGTVTFGAAAADRICFLAVGLRMTMEQFKQELASAYANGTPYAVCYELATPIERDTPLDLTYNVYQNGTEKLLPENGSTPTTTPLDATIKYPAETKDVYFTYQVSNFLSTVFKFYLVTKGIQIPCELENDTLVADCTSEISSEPGFFDCKIKAENDLGQIFSNKFQLHIERSPQ